MSEDIGLDWSLDAQGFKDPSRQSRSTVGWAGAWNKESASRNMAEAKKPASRTQETRHK